MPLHKKRGWVISLCDRTGQMVLPWSKAGFRCLCLDLQHPMRSDRQVGRVTYRWADIRALTPSSLPVPAIVFAFPPCTHLAISGAQDFPRKGLRAYIDALELVESCRMLCEWYGCPWMIENPVGRLSTAWRKPDFIFQPWQYGDNYYKKTCLWVGGGFKIPTPTVSQVPPDCDERIHRAGPGPNRANYRSITPLGFAQAVFSANYQAVQRFEMNHREG